MYIVWAILWDGFLFVDHGSIGVGVYVNVFLGHGMHGCMVECECEFSIPHIPNFLLLNCTIYSVLKIWSAVSIIFFF